MASIETENLKQEKGWLLKLFSIFMTLSIMVSSWFLKETMDKLNSLDKRLYSLELSEARTTSNRFTSVDWNIQKSLLESDKLIVERRIIKMEESIPQIKEALQRIETAIERTNNRIDK